MSLTKSGSVTQSDPDTTVSISSRDDLADAYGWARSFSEALCEPLEIEDHVIQAMADASPPRWNLAHTSWFFETFLLKEFVPDYKPVHPAYEYLFNSYYQAVGPQYSRPRRGLLTRPTVREVYDYRKEIDRRMHKLLTEIPETDFERVHDLTILGMHHEQQHQELMLTDIKYNFFVNPLFPKYRPACAEARPPSKGAVSDAKWVKISGGIHEIGHQTGGYCFDNELPVHKRYVEDFKLQNRLITVEEYLEFMKDGGYGNFSLWLSDGWRWLQENQIEAPLYWVRREDDWKLFTLDGLRDLELSEPVCHVSHYEADAFAAWRGCRLATEAEWEIAARAAALPAEAGNFIESGALHPLSPGEPPVAQKIAQMFGDVWEWTSSAYLPYPGYKASPGALGEYNGKFMSGQMVLRGGSCATPMTHIRPAYRNFFSPEKRWQFSGIRLANTG